MTIFARLTDCAVVFRPAPTNAHVRQTDHRLAGRAQNGEPHWAGPIEHVLVRMQGASRGPPHSVIPIDPAPGFGPKAAMLRRSSASGIGEAE